MPETSLILLKWFMLVSMRFVKPSPRKRCEAGLINLIGTSRIFKAEISNSTSGFLWPDRQCNAIQIIHLPHFHDKIVRFLFFILFSWQNGTLFIFTTFSWQNGMFFIFTTFSWQSGTFFYFYHIFVTKWYVFLFLPHFHEEMEHFFIFTKFLCRNGTFFYFYQISVTSFYIF